MFKLHGTTFFSLYSIPRYVHHRSERKESFSEVHSAPLDTIHCLSTCCKRELVLLQSCARKEGLQQRAFRGNDTSFVVLATLSISCGVVHPTERYKNASFLIFVRPLRVLCFLPETLVYHSSSISRFYVVTLSLHLFISSYFTRRICKSFAIKLVSFSLSLLDVSLDYLQPCQHYYGIFKLNTETYLSIYAYVSAFLLSRRECKILSFKYISMLTARVAIETKIKISTVSLMLASLSLFIYMYICGRSLKDSRLQKYIKI